MSVTLTKNSGRTRFVEGRLYLERWIQIDAGTDQIFADLNALDALADSRTAAGGGVIWYDAPSPGEYDAGQSIKTWYGQAIRLPFHINQASGAWVAFKAELQSFVETAFPGEIILEANRRLEDKPAPTTPPDAPAKFLLWAVEYD